MKIVLTTFREYPFLKPYADSIRFNKIEEGLKEADHDIYIVAKNQRMRFEKKGNLYLIPSSGVKFLGELIVLLLAPYYMNKITASVEADVVYTYSIFYALWLKRLKMKKYKVHLDVLGIEHREKNKGPRQGLMAKILGALEISQMKKADLITTVNEAHKKVIAHYSKTIIIVLRDALDKRYLKKSANNLDCFKLIFIGSIANRRLDDLFHALSMLKSKNLSVEIVGDGVDLSFYQDWAKTISSVPIKFYGYVQHEKVFGLIENSNLCFSDDWSIIGFPVKVFEYMGLGKVSIVQDTPATREIITDGENGILYNGYEDLKEKLESLSQNKYKLERISNNAYNLISKNHTWEKRKEELVEIYRNI